MPGCRYLTDDEIRRILRMQCRDLKDSRDRLLFVLGITTGFRISELLSIKYKDVWDFDKLCVKCELKVDKQYMKGKKASRVIPIGDLLAKEIKEYILKSILKINRNSYLFLGPYNPDKAISYRAAIKALKILLTNAGINVEGNGRLGTHCLRKTFAKNVRDLTGNDLVEMQRCLGHKNINSTTSYVEDCKPEREEMIKTMYHKLSEEEEEKMLEEEQTEYVDFR